MIRRPPRSPLFPSTPLFRPPGAPRRPRRARVLLRDGPQGPGGSASRSRRRGEPAKGRASRRRRRGEPAKGRASRSRRRGEPAKRAARVIFHDVYTNVPPEEIVRFVRSQELGRLVTVAPDGTPHLGLYPFTYDGAAFEIHLVRSDEQIADLGVRPRCMFE